MKRVISISVLFALVLVLPISATILNVPADSSTIQGGINGASNGDTVLVAPGTYYERINYYGKGISVASNYIYSGDSLDIQNTIIDADTSIIGYVDTGSVVCFVNGEDSTSVLQGFTISGGTGTLTSSGDHNGGGVYCYATSPLVINCIISYNTAAFGGGIGVFWGLSNPQFINCKIALNTSQESGAGVWCGPGHSMVFDTCEFERDQEIWSQIGFPGGIVTILNSTLKNTGIDLNGGVGSSVTIVDSKLDSCYIRYYSNITLINDSLTHSAITIMNECTADLNNCVLIGTNISVSESWVEVDSCYIEGDISSNSIAQSFFSINNSEIHGDITALICQISVDNTTIIGGKIALYSGPGSWATLNNSIVLSNGGAAIEVSDNPLYPDINIYCSDFFGFDSTGWLEGTPNILDTSNVYFEDPRFCDAQNGDYTIEDVSICAPANNACITQIGAYGVGCSLTTIPTLNEWGMLIMGLLLLAAGTVAVLGKRKQLGEINKQGS